MENDIITYHEYMEARRIVDKYHEQIQKIDALPQFVKLGKAVLRLEKYDGLHKVQYWRDAGAWGVGIMFRRGKFYSVSDNDDLDFKELTPATLEEWQEDNTGYIGESNEQKE